MTEIILNAVPATTYDSDDAGELLEWCRVNGIRVFEAPPITNAAFTLVLPPHGDKAWSEGANEHEVQRKIFISHLNQLEGWFWVEVQYGECNYRIVGVDDGADVAMPIMGGT